MSKEEGLGWLLAEMFARKLLIEEARGLGKRDGKQTSVTLKAEQEKIASVAKTARSKAGKAAKRDSELAAIVDAEIARIDAEAEHTSHYNCLGLGNSPETGHHLGSELMQLGNKLGS